MTNLSTTKLSSKGQVVIPEEIRQKLKLHSGDQFLVIAEKDVVVLKIISMPAMKEFDVLIKTARQAAKKVSLKKKAILEAVKEARKK